MNPLLSILIPTIEGREHFFDRLTNKIITQINNNKLDIEILFEKDKKGESTIGEKRNKLLQKSKGLWACFIDDDDLIADNYLSQAISVLKSENPDCINLIGQLTIDGNNPQIFIHELRYRRYFTENNIHYRPPNHLNIIRTSISKNFKFPEKNHGEDTDWAMQICNSNALNTEGRIEQVNYFYEYISNKKL